MQPTLRRHGQGLVAFVDIVSLCLCGQPEAEESASTAKQSARRSLDVCSTWLAVEPAKMDGDAGVLPHGSRGGEEGQDTPNPLAGSEPEAADPELGFGAEDDQQKASTVFEVEEAHDQQKALVEARMQHLRRKQRGQTVLKTLLIGPTVINWLCVLWAEWFGTLEVPDSSGTVHTMSLAPT